MRSLTGQSRDCEHDHFRVDFKRSGRQGCDKEAEANKKRLNKARGDLDQVEREEEAAGEQ